MRHCEESRIVELDCTRLRHHSLELIIGPGLHKNLTKKTTVDLLQCQSSDHHVMLDVDHHVMFRQIPMMLSSGRFACKCHANVKWHCRPMLARGHKVVSL